MLIATNAVEVVFFNPTFIANSNDDVRVEGFAVDAPINEMMVLFVAYKYFLFHSCKCPL
jgi:hypothetical protein